jgi:branched-chain amino acid transport system permease protein
VLHLLGEATRGLVSSLPGVNLVVYGALLVLMIMFLPRGIIGLAK